MIADTSAIWQQCAAQTLSHFYQSGSHINYALLLPLQPSLISPDFTRWPRRDQYWVGVFLFLPESTPVGLSPTRSGIVVNTLTSLFISFQKSYWSGLAILDFLEREK